MQTQAGKLTKEQRELISSWLKSLPEEEENLYISVIIQLGGRLSFLNQYENVLASGADGGFNGFIYNDELVNFYENNKCEILQLLFAQSEELGQSVEETLKSFKSLADEPNPLLLLLLENQYSYLVKISLAHYSLEECCRSLSNFLEN